MKRHYPYYSLPEGYGIQLDHAIPITFADAMGIPREAGSAVLVPGFANASRTNNRNLVQDFSNFDWRMSVQEQITNLKDGLNRLVLN